MKKESNDSALWFETMPHYSSFTLDHSSAALVILDMQYANACRHTGRGNAVKERGEEEKGEWRFTRIEGVVLPNIIRLLDFFRKNKLRIIYITVGSEMPDYSDILPHQRETRKADRNTRGTRHHEILDEIKPLPGECVVNKLTHGAFNSSNIDFILKSMGTRYLIFTGASTASCVEGTLRDADDRGYHCLAVEDGCADWTEERHNGAITRFRRMGRVERTDDVIKELSTALSQQITVS